MRGADNQRRRAESVGQVNTHAAAADACPHYHSCRLIVKAARETVRWRPTVQERSRRGGIRWWSSRRTAATTAGPSRLLLGGSPGRHPMILRGSDRSKAEHQSRGADQIQEPASASLWFHRDLPGLRWKTSLRLIIRFAAHEYTPRLTTLARQPVLGERTREAPEMIIPIIQIDA